MATAEPYLSPTFPRMDGYINFYFENIYVEQWASVIPALGPLAKTQAMEKVFASCHSVLWQAFNHLKLSLRSNQLCLTPQMNST